MTDSNINITADMGLTLGIATKTGMLPGLEESVVPMTAVCRIAFGLGTCP